MTKCLDTTQQRLVLEKLLREKKQRILILRQDSIIMKRDAEIVEIDEELFVTQSKYELCADAAKAFEKEMTKVQDERDKFKKETVELKEKARKRKKWKWIFGGVGFVGGVLISLL